jgi:hypothetical protein
VSNGSGISDTSTVAVTVDNEADPKTLFYFKSAVGDPAGLGTSGMVTSADHLMGQPNLFAGTVATDLPPIFPVTSDWLVEFVESNFTPLSGPSTGVFFVTPGSNFPFLLASQGTEDCEGGVAATYVVRDIGIQTDDEGGTLVTHLGVDFIQYCDASGAPLIAAYRYNSTTPVVGNPPAASPGPARTFNSPGVVVLDGSVSFPGIDTTATYSWNQTGGPAVLLQNKNKPIAQFNLPASLLTTAGTTLTFALTVSNAYGSNTATTHITAILPATVTLSLQSDSGDPIGGGNNFSYSAPQEGITLRSVGKNGIEVSVANGPRDNWLLGLAAAKGRTLSTGTYSGVVRYTGAALSTPSLYIGSISRRASCATVSGDFNVLDVQYTASGAIESLALDFDQTCNGASGALHGKLRYHSAIP